MSEQAPPDLGLIPAEASPPEVLELEPHDYVSATEGPHPVPDQTEYVTMTKPDGDTFLAQSASVDYYVAKGYTAGASVTIDDKWTYANDPANQKPPEVPPEGGGASG